MAQQWSLYAYADGFHGSDHCLGMNATTALLIHDAFTPFQKSSTFGDNSVR